MLRRPNAAPLQTQHTRRYSTRMRRRGPEQSARTQQSCDFSQQHTRVAQVFENLSGCDHVEVLRRKLRVLKFTLEHFKSERAHVLHCVLGNVEAVCGPTILAGSDKQVASAAADVEQTICLPVRRKLGGDLFESCLYERRRCQTRFRIVTLV